MPIQHSRYPVNWPAVAAWLKEQADWTCQECGLKCRRPGEPVDRTRLCTVAHVYPESHAPDAEVVCVMVLCFRCHLRFDAAHSARQMRLYHRRFHMALPAGWALHTHGDLTAADVAELEAIWPTLEDVPEGVDYLADVWPVVGGPL